jgi:hypothetical protein
MGRMRAFTGWGGKEYSQSKSFHRMGRIRDFTGWVGFF